MSAAEPLRTWTSLQCDDGRHSACRGPEWSCQCSCHQGVAAVASDHDPGSHGPPRPAPGSWSDTASDAVASTDPVAGAEPPPATLHGAGSVDGAASTDETLGSDLDGATAVAGDEDGPAQGSDRRADGSAPASPS